MPPASRRNLRRKVWRERVSAQRLNVTNLSGELVMTLPFDAKSTVEDLKRHLEAAEPPMEPALRPRLELVHGGSVLPAGRSLAECGVAAGALLVLVRAPRVLLLSSAFDHTVRLWDVFAAEEGALRTVCQTESSVTALCPEPSHGRVLMGLSRGALQLLDMGTGKCVKEFEGHRRAVSGIWADWNTQKFVSASWDHTIAFWDMQAGATPLRIFKGHSNEVTCLSVEWEARRVASASLDGVLRIWDFDTEHAVQALPDPDGVSVLAVQVDWSSEWALAGLESGLLRLWDLRLWRPALALPGHQRAVWSLAADWRGQRALSSSADATLRLWDLVSGETIRVMLGHSGIVWSLSVDWAAGRAISASHDLTLRVWDLEDSVCMCVLRGHVKSVLCVALL